MTVWVYWRDHLKTKYIVENCSGLSIHITTNQTKFDYEIAILLHSEYEITTENNKLMVFGFKHRFPIRGYYSSSTSNLVVKGDYISKYIRFKSRSGLDNSNLILMLLK